MDVPPVGLTKLADKHTIVKSVQINIVIIRSRDNKFTSLDILIFNNLNCVDHRLVSNYEEVFSEELIC